MTLQSTTQPPSTTTPIQQTTPSYECPRDTNYDIFLVLDSSSNADAPTFERVSNSNCYYDEKSDKWLQMKQFSLDFTKQFTLSSIYTQVALFVFSNYVMIESPLGEFTQDQLQQVLQQVSVHASSEVLLDLYVIHIKDSYE